MAAGLRIRVVNTQDGSGIERTFDRSPIRIGRSSINELSIQSPFVSQFHAVIEFDGQKVVLRDLGSTNGTLLRTSGRVQPNTPVDLTSQNFEFAIVSLWFQLFSVNAVPAPAVVKREGTILSLDYNELQKMMRPAGATGARPSVSPGGPQGPDRTKEMMGRVQPMYDEYRASWSKLYREMFSMMTPLDPASRERMLKQMAVDMAGMQHEGDFQRLSTHFGTSQSPIVPGSPNDTMRDDAVALAALRDLAATYAPQRGPLEKVVDIVGFTQKVQDLLGVFFKCFLALRDGHRQFKTQLDIKKTFRPNEQLSAARAVETAREPRELAARLLDWSDPSNEGSRAIESTFAEVMVHQVAMLSGVMRGVRSLLAKLAPPSIEAELENPRRRAATGSTFGPFRYKTLWDLYTEIYGDFAEDEKQAFALIFGSEFAHAYSELAGEAPSPGAQLPAGQPSAFGHPQSGAPSAFNAPPQMQGPPQGGGVARITGSGPTVPQQPPWAGPPTGGRGPTQR